MNKFDGYRYFKTIHEQLLDLKDFSFGRVSDKKTLEAIINNARTSNSFFCVDDTEEGQIIPFAGGYAERKVCFVWILKKYTKNNQSTTLEECKSIYRDIISRIIADRDKGKEGLTYIADRFPFWEIPSMIFPEATGLYFTISIGTPLALCFNPEKWQE